MDSYTLHKTGHELKGTGARVPASEDEDEKIQVRRASGFRRYGTSCGLFNLEKGGGG